MTFFSEIIIFNEIKSINDSFRSLGGYWNCKVFNTEGKNILNDAQVWKKLIMP